MTVKQEQALTEAGDGLASETGALGPAAVTDILQARQRAVDKAFYGLDPLMCFVVLVL
jgi:hypothetical protein